MQKEKVSIRQVIEKIYRDLGRNRIPVDAHQDVIEWIGEALEKIGTSEQYDEEPHVITIAKYRGKWPKGFIAIKSIRYNNRPLRYGSGISPNNTYLHSTESLNLLKIATQDYYTVNHSFISTSFKEGEILAEIYTREVDEEGYPLVPKDQMVFEALFHYVEMKLSRPLWVEGKIRDGVYLKMEQDWGNYCTGAANSLNFPTIDEVEGIRAMWMRLMPQMGSYEHFFQDSINGEYNL